MKKLLLGLITFTFCHLAIAGYQLPLPGRTDFQTDAYYSILEDVLANKLDGKYNAYYLGDYDYNVPKKAVYLRLFSIVAKTYMMMNTAERDNPEQTYKYFTELHSHKPFSDLSLPAFIGQVYGSLMVYATDYTNGHFVAPSAKSLLSMVEKKNLYLATEAELIKVATGASRTDALKDNAIAEIKPVPESSLGFKIGQVWGGPPGYKANRRVLDGVGMVMTIQNPGRPAETFEIPNHDDLNLPQVWSVSIDDYDKRFFYDVSGRKVLVTSGDWAISVWISDTQASNWKLVATMAPQNDNELRKPRVNTSGAGIYNMLMGHDKIQLGQKDGALYLTVLGAQGEMRGGLYKLYKLTIAAQL